MGRCGDDGGFALNIAEWNQALRDHFFGPEMADRQVFLSVTHELLVELAGIPSASSDLVAAVVSDSEDPLLVAARAVELCASGSWRTASDDPPYLAHLALFVLAAGIADDALQDRDYYPRLWLLLGVDGQGPPRHFRPDLADVVWPDLEVWSQLDLAGSQGIFRVHAYGDQRHVGIPRGQMLLSEEERENLTSAFLMAGLEPGEEYSSSYLAHVLRRAEGLQRRTQRILERPSDDAMRVGLLSVVADELSAWDGTGSLVAGPAGERMAVAALRLFVLPDEDQLASGEVYLRAHSATRALPEDDGEHVLPSIVLPHGSGVDLRASEPGSPWSAPYSVTADIWRSGLEIRSTDGHWLLRLHQRDIRLLERARFHGLGAGWVEVPTLDPERELLILFAEHLESDIRSLAGDSLKLRRLSGALPQGWLAATARAVGDVSVLNRFAPETLPVDRPSISLVGGIRIDRRSEFFAFAPPTIRVRGVRESDVITIRQGNVTLPVTHAVDGLIDLPAELVLDEKAQVSVDRDGHVVAAARLMLGTEYEWKHGSDLRLGGDGLSEEPSGMGHLGGYYAKDLARDVDPTLVSSLAHLGGAMFFLGREVGQVAAAAGGAPPAWAEWAVVRRTKRKFRVVRLPVLDMEASNEKEDVPVDVKLWRYWARRTRALAVPERKRDREAWAAYRKRRS